MARISSYPYDNTVTDNDAWMRHGWHMDDEWMMNG